MLDQQVGSKGHGALYNLLNNPSAQQPLSLVIQAFLFILIMVSTLIFCIETMPQFYVHDSSKNVMWYIEAVCIACFTVELFLRFMVRPPFPRAVGWSLKEKIKQMHPASKGRRLANSQQPTRRVTLAQSERSHRSTRGRRGYELVQRRFGARLERLSGRRELTRPFCGALPQLLARAVLRHCTPFVAGCSSLVRPLPCANPTRWVDSRDD